MKSIPTMIAELPPFEQRYARALAEVELLKAALEKRQRGGHGHLCEWDPSKDWNRVICRCGYDDAHAALEAVK